MSGAAAHAEPTAINVDAVAMEFPILSRTAHGKRLVYLDNAATSFAPEPVIEAMAAFQRRSHGAVHRAVHTLGAEATEAYEGARASVARFLGGAPDEIVFVRGVTEAMNLLAFSLAERTLKPGDRVIATVMEHHSNLLPWMQACERRGAELRLAPLTPSGEIDLDQFERLLTNRTKIVALTHVSNVLGTVNPVPTLSAMAKRVNATVVVDGAQAASRLPVRVRDLGCDFYAISGHKIHGPTGVGALWGRREALAELPPWQTGGSMVERVAIGATTWAPAPTRFEAGTPNSAGAVGLRAAVEFLERIGMSAIAAHERCLTQRMITALESIPGLRIHGDPAERAGIVSFAVEGVHPHDLATLLDCEGVAVRAGHHCAQPLMEWLGVPATSRASLALYNRVEDIEALACGVRSAIERLQ